MVGKGWIFPGLTPHKTVVLLSACVFIRVGDGGADGDGTMERWWGMRWWWVGEGWGRGGVVVGMVG